METTGDDTNGGVLPIILALVLVQAGIATFAFIEVTLVAAFGFGSVGLPVLLTLTGSLVILALVRGLRLRRRRARRFVIATEVVMVVIGVVNLGLALLLTQQPVELVPVLTHFLIPLSVIHLLRRAAVRAEFPSRARPAMPAPLLVEASSS